MPLYELLCLARPALAKQDVLRMVQRIGSVVYDKGGVVTNFKSYGDQYLAYKIKGVHGKYDQVNGCQISMSTKRL